MNYEIFCITLFFSTAIIPFVLLTSLILTGISYLADRKRERAEQEALKEIVESWSVMPPDYHIKLWHTLKNNLSIDDFNKWYIGKCKKTFRGKCKHRKIDENGVCHIYASCPFHKLKMRCGK